MGEPFSLNWIDLVIVMIVVSSMAVSLWRGFGREILSLINFFVAFLIARLFSAQLAGVLIDTIHQPMLRNIAAYGALFFMSLTVGGLIMRGVSKLIKFGGLELFDRLMGTVFGFARGMIVVLVVIGTLNWGGWVAHTQVWRESNLVPLVLPLETWSRELARLWLFERDMDGLADSLMWQIDALQNQRELQTEVKTPGDVLQMLGPR